MYKSKKKKVSYKSDTENIFWISENDLYLFFYYYSMNNNIYDV